MEPLKTFVSRTVVLPIDNIDTDQIIPARFLKGTTKSGLGEKLFSDWRYDAQGNRKPDFVLNRPESEGAQVLVAGDNFGCGSSREHAPWALVAFGFRAVISTSIADIFTNNALKNGLLPIVVEPALHRRLLAEPGASVTISLEDQTLRLDDGSGASATSGTPATTTTTATTAKFTVEPFARYCLLNGVDELAFLLSADADISAFETRK